MHASLMADNDGEVPVQQLDHMSALLWSAGNRIVPDFQDVREEPTCGYKAHRGWLPRQPLPQQVSPKISSAVIMRRHAVDGLACP